MSEAIMTQEFSICLLADAETTDQILDLRSRLPESPYRDDSPHITLLRGITAPRHLSDNELLDELRQILNAAGSLPYQATVSEVTNKGNALYASSGLLLLQTPPELLDYRQRIANSLLDQAYAIEEQELATYTPHITVRLGVELIGAQLFEAEATFRNKVVSFDNWVLFRLMKDGDKRFMHEVKA